MNGTQIYIPGSISPDHVTDRTSVDTNRFSKIDFEDQSAYYNIFIYGFRKIKCITIQK